MLKQLFASWLGDYKPIFTSLSTPCELVSRMEIINIADKVP